MVQLSYAAVSFLLVAPSLALPLQSLDERSQELDAREPFRFGNIVKGVSRIAHNKGVRKAAHIASMFIREDTSEINARDLADVVQAFQDVSERDLEELAIREPNFFKKFKHAFHKVANIGKKVWGVAKNFIREEDDEGVFAREDLSELFAFSARDLEEMEELAAREPRFGFLKKIGHAVRKVSRFAGPAARIASNFIREDGDELFTREDMADLLDLSERELDEMEELAARDPRGFFKKFKHIASRVGRIAKPAIGIASNFIREEAEGFDDLMARDYDYDNLD